MGSSYLQTAANLTAGVSGLSILEMGPNDASPREPKGYIMERLRAMPFVMHIIKVPPLVSTT